jgi:hypothetical protein
MGPAERRTERRLLCSNLVQISWSGSKGHPCREIGVLENLSRGGFGVCIHLSVSIRRGTELSILANQFEFRGRVVQCNPRESGYLVGLELDKPCEWEDGFGPEHLLDVMLLNLE